ncbi:MAG: tetratricopeptide repeat protein [Phycisphaerales bacterium]
MSQTSDQNASPSHAARSAGAYLALLPLLAIVCVGGYFAVRLALAPPASAGAAGTGGGGSPASTEDELATVDIVAERAQQHLGEDRSERAEALLSGALQRFPREQELWLLYAEVMMDLKRPEEALASFETAIEIGPDHPEYRNAAGTLASQLGDPLTAEIHWAAGQKADPTDPRFPFFLAQLQRADGRIGEARANLLLAARLNPDLSEAWGTLAAIAFDEGHYGPALQHLERAKALEPDRPLWRLIEARVYRRQGDPERAAAVLSMIPDERRLTDAVILRELGLCLGMLRQPGEAAETYLEALAFITIRDAEAELVYDEEGNVLHDPRSPDALRAELHYEAALWLDRGDDPRRSLAQARAAEALGHTEAAALVRRLIDEGADTVEPPERIDGGDGVPDGRAEPVPGSEDTTPTPG